jgi:hypothetical protein
MTATILLVRIAISGSRKPLGGSEIMMAIRKISDLYFPEHYRLMLHNGSWRMYDTEMSCPVDRVDRRLALELVKTGFVGNKFVDHIGRLMYSRLTPDAADLGVGSAPDDKSTTAPSG